MRWHALFIAPFVLFASAALSQEPPRDAPPPTQPSQISPSPADAASPDNADQRPLTAQHRLPPLPPDAPRMALVIGQGAYASGAPATAVNDAGLMAEALRGAGFDLTQGADLDEAQLRETVRAFLERLEQAPPDSAVVVYLAGRAVQYEGENIFLPVGTRLERESDAPLRGIRLGDLASALAETPPRVKIVLVDSSGATMPFRNGRNPAPGLAIMEPPENVAIGFATAPDAVAPTVASPYGAYARALVEMMRLPGLGIDDFLAKVRLRVHEDTKGQQTPWDAVNFRAHDFNFFVPEANLAPPPAPQTMMRLEGRALRDYPPAEAYAIVIERDRIADYQEFLRIYPDDPLARRVKALLAQRREALMWRKAIARNSSASYWTYLRTYPQGTFVVEARRRLARLQAQPVPPDDFVPLIYEDVPPPLADIEIVEPGYALRAWRDLPPPPPPPVYILPPLEPDFVLAPPPPRAAPFILPVPVFVNRPRWARPPAPRQPPPPVRALAPQPQAPQPVLQTAPQPNVQPAPSASPQIVSPPANRRALRQMLQQRQQQLQTQQGRPVTPTQRRELRQQLRQEQLRAQQQRTAPQVSPPPPQFQRAQPVPGRSPAPAAQAPDSRQQRQQEMQQQRQQQMQQQRQQEVQQQRQQQMQQRQQEVQQQRQQQMQQQRAPTCGQPNQPPCPR